MTTVTITSHKAEREKEILADLEKGLERVGAIVERQAKIPAGASAGTDG
jgi:hypothetical protein